MEYFNQNKENQRKSERFVIILYSLYAFSLCYGVIKLKWDLWVPAVMAGMLAVGWTVFLTKYRNPRVRAAITTVLMQLTVVLYAAKVDNLSNVIPTFLALSVLIAMYGYSELLWGTVISLLFMIFYHSVIIDTIWTMPGETRAHLLYQLGNIFSVEFVLYVWLKFRRESDEQVHKIIDALMDA